VCAQQEGGNHLTIPKKKENGLDVDREGEHLVVGWVLLMMMMIWSQFQCDIHFIKSQKPD